MAACLHLYYIDWEEFHQRFSVDLAEADKETETSDGIFAESFFSDYAYGVEEFSYHLLNELEGIYESLKKACFATDPKNLDWWQQLRSLPKSELLEPGTLDFEFCQQWLLDFEFAFSRLEPLCCGDVRYRRDSALDFSPIKGVGIGTLSPETVAQTAARFPTLDILRFPRCKAIIDGVEGNMGLEYFLKEFERIVRRACDEGKGLCLFMI